MRERQLYRIERRIGRYVAVARSEERFGCLFDLVNATCASVLDSPPRLLSSSHLANAVARRLNWLRAETLPLIEGYVYQLISDGTLVRVVSVTQTGGSFPVIATKRVADSCDRALIALEEALRSVGYVRRDDVSSLVDPELCLWERNIDVLLRVLIGKGIAGELDSSRDLGSGVSLPYADSRG
jgi:hypothetical protein